MLPPEFAKGGHVQYPSIAPAKVEPAGVCLADSCANDCLLSLHSAAAAGASLLWLKPPAVQASRHLQHVLELLQAPCSADPCLTDEIQRVLEVCIIKAILLQGNKQPDWWTDNIGREVQQAAEPARTQPQAGSREEFEQNLGRQVSNPWLCVCVCVLVG